MKYCSVFELDDRVELRSLVSLLSDFERLWYPKLLNVLFDRLDPAHLVDRHCQPDQHIDRHNADRPSEQDAHVVDVPVVQLHPRSPRDGSLKHPCEEKHRGTDKL